jgi:NtrC-family two-component system response regulator AlgB
VVLPPLRERPSDVLALTNHLLQFFVKQAGKAITGFTQEAREAMLRYPWPGNVRELRNAIERGVILAGSSEIGLAELPAQVGATLPPAVMEIGGAVTLEQLEADHIRRVLARTATMEQAAAVLGIDPSTLYRKRKRYGL